jgi:hypothetical protein
MASRSEHRSRRRWLLADGGYVLVEGARTLGGPYPEVALVYGPEPKASSAPGPGRPRTKSRAHEPLQAAITQMARVATPAATLADAPIVLHMTAPPDAARQFAEELEDQLRADGHSIDAIRARIVIAHGAFDPSVVNAALISPAHAQAFLRDWEAGRARLLALPEDEGPDDSSIGHRPTRG